MSVFVVFASTKVVCTVPVMGVRPVQLKSALIPVEVTDTLITWHCAFCGLLYGPPYLSIIACVTQTCCVRDPICGMFGIPLMLIWLVTSQRPAFLCPCALAAIEIKQQLTTTQIPVLLILPPGRAAI